MAPVFLCIILAWLVAERIRHDRRLARIPIRIHVNGTRGKSGVTRLIAAALRRSGIRTVAKTTGGAPVLILPDGSEETIRRWSPANIQEQVKVIARADRLGARAVVIECMALDPALQSVSEAAMIRSTVGVITNVRPDHFEVMGGTLDEVAEALSNSIPSGGVVVTADRRYFPFFMEAAGRKGSRAVLAGDRDADGDDPGNGVGFFRENVEIARSVCRELGLDPAVVDECLRDGAAGEAAGIHRIPLGGRTVHFLDAFSANDVESTRILQERAMARDACPRPWIALFNNRADRPLRMKSFADDLLAGSPYDLIAVTGEGRGLARRHFRRAVRDKEIVILPGAAPDRLLGELSRNAAWKECTVVGMGNEKWKGRSLSRLFRERCAR
jgi:poly-gamma-glutamate synthase PgsB/CapB